MRKSAILATVALLALAGIAATDLKFEEILARIDAAQQPAKRGPYKKRAAV